MVGVAPPETWTNSQHCSLGRVPSEPSYQTRSLARSARRRRRQRGRTRRCASERNPSIGPAAQGGNRWLQSTACRGACRILFAGFPASEPRPVAWQPFPDSPGAGRGAPIAGLRSGTSWWVEPVTSHEPAILAEHAGWLVVAKPAGWHTVRGKTESDDAGGGVVESWLATARPDLASPSSRASSTASTGTPRVAWWSLATQRRTSGAAAAFAAATGLRKIYLSRAAGLAERRPPRSSSRAATRAPPRSPCANPARPARRGACGGTSSTAARAATSSRSNSSARGAATRSGRLAYLGHPLVGDEPGGGGRVRRSCTRGRSKSMAPRSRPRSRRGSRSTRQATALPRSAAKRGSCRAPVCGGEAEGAVGDSTARPAPQAAKV